MLPALFELTDGRLFVECARGSLSFYLRHKKIQICSDLQSDQKYSKKTGCFVTLRDQKKSLRGCIGFPEPIYPLPKALTLSAISAGTEDPRFSPIKRPELDSLTIEVSVLSAPNIIRVKDPRDYKNEIALGSDGLIMKWSFGSGLLLPQVPIEEKWTVEEFLSNLSMKAGALPDQWLLPETQIARFQAQVFEEVEPNGRVVTKM